MKKQGSDEINERNQTFVCRFDTPVTKEKGMKAKQNTYWAMNFWDELTLVMSLRMNTTNIVHQNYVDMIVEYIIMISFCSSMVAFI